MRQSKKTKSKSSGIPQTISKNRLDILVGLPVRLISIDRLPGGIVIPKPSGISGESKYIFVYKQHRCSDFCYVALYQKSIRLIEDRNEYPIKVYLNDNVSFEFTKYLDTSYNQEIERRMHDVGLQLVD
jgi:hypothetical protein